MRSLQTPYEKAFDSLTEEYHINKFVEQNFLFVQPVEYILKNLYSDDDTVERTQYVPLLDTPFSSDRQHLSYDGSLEVGWEIIRTVLCCIVY